MHPCFHYCQSPSHSTSPNHPCVSWCGWIAVCRGGGLQIPPLMLVGDPDQLPPVGAGQPVADALAEGLLPCIDLRQIYRTAADSAIVTTAHAINRGREEGCIVWYAQRNQCARTCVQSCLPPPAHPFRSFNLTYRPMVAYPSCLTLVLAARQPQAVPSIPLTSPCQSTKSLQNKQQCHNPRMCCPCRRDAAVQCHMGHPPWPHCIRHCTQHRPSSSTAWWTSHGGPGAVPAPTGPLQC